MSNMPSNLLFFELVQIAIGKKERFSKQPSKSDWQMLYDIARKQALIGICFHGIKRLPQEQTTNMPLPLKMQWLALTASIQKRNEIMNRRCFQLQKRLEDAGYSGCILKGQGIAAIYTESLSNLRQSGDIDIWVKGGLDSIIALAKKLNQRTILTEQHADLRFFEDAEVEAHFIPTMLKNPFANKRLQRWIKQQEYAQFANHNRDELCVPTLQFNLVYLMIHTYRHIFGEGIGLRQVMDYYMLLCSHSIDEKLKANTIRCLRSFNLHKFAAGLMWVLKEVFQLSTESLLCPPNKKHGQFILNEIMIAGNMGHYDKRLIAIQNASKLKRFCLINIHTFRLLKYYPAETLFAPIIRMWVWIWRKKQV